MDVFPAMFHRGSKAVRSSPGTEHLEASVCLEDRYDRCRVSLSILQAMIIIYPICISKIHSLVIHDLKTMIDI